ncbi:hypothetical protein LSUE1_G003087 [Lachnellula suecica]|uniref:Uncharacterized protein n=1 Tax=Lachnellula suecica TaxID=602035 RepID=A0A8T9CAD0_9HELO|nr:hypothetical protein LSUE1_G003087 [Lachnellula suecica]
MRASNVLALSALSTAAFAAPAPAAQAGSSINDPYYSWQVTDWSAGCASSGCFYDFNIAGSNYKTDSFDFPPFTAACSGAGVGAPFTPCAVNGPEGEPGNRGVVARLLPAETGAGAHIEVSFEWVDLNQANTYYNFTGDAIASYNQFVGPLEAFTITPSSAFGVA